MKIERMPTMPPRPIIILLLCVIAAAGATVWVATAISGGTGTLVFGLIALAALLAAVVVRRLP